MSIEPTVQTTSWCLEPRDPLVFGDGSRTPALAPRHRFLLPPQGTLAGMVRTRFAAELADVSKEDARRLLDIHIRGPWLARFQNQGENPVLWLPIPADVMAVRDGKSESYLPGELLPLNEGEGTLWPSGAFVPRMLVHSIERLESGTKTSRPHFPFWPFERVVRWNVYPGLDGSIREVQRHVRPEYRVHTAVEDTTWTAEPEALFSTPGLRYDTSFGIAAEVTDHRGLRIPPGPSPDAPPHLLVLGAEARTVSCKVQPGPCFPSFDDYRSLYSERIAQLLADGREIGLRLQLLTPGCFGDWQPRWPKVFAGKLLTTCLERYVPVSGWDLQAKGPRAVRRLVPAGSVYFLGPFTGASPEDTFDHVLTLCSDWWGGSLCAGEEGEEKTFLAPPSHDGYGLVLPAPFGLPRSLMP